MVMQKQFSLSVTEALDFAVLDGDTSKPVQVWDSLQVEPPIPEQIKDLRQRVGTQTKCAKIAGVNISNWQRWEKGDQRPHPTTWGLFLLATGQHPSYEILPR